MCHSAPTLGRLCVTQSHSQSQLGSAFPSQSPAAGGERQHGIKTPAARGKDKLRRGDCEDRFPTASAALRRLPRQVVLSSCNELAERLAAMHLLASVSPDGLAGQEAETSASERRSDRRVREA